MRPTILDLSGDERWRVAAGSSRALYVSLADSRFWIGTADENPLIIDARGRHDEGVALLAAIGSHPRRHRILLTDRETPRAHGAAYLAGATRVVVMSCGDLAAPSLLDELCAGVRG